MELPDQWDAVKNGVTAVCSADETFTARMQKSLVEEFGGEEQGPGAIGRRW